MKIIVIYLSLTGNTKKLAVKIYETLKSKNYDISLFEIACDKKKSFFRNCFDTLFEKKVEIEKVPNLSNYEIIFLGTPVWVGKITPYIRKFIEEIDLTGKKVFLFTTYGSGFLKDKAMNEFGKYVQEKGGKIIGKIQIKGKKIDEKIEEIKKCLKEL
ncbi:MAG: flavodoxin domain-containing protein [bacterium]|nr:flavodoxin domain-containing protein [bacterium]